MITDQRIYVLPVDLEYAGWWEGADSRDAQAVVRAMRVAGLNAYSATSRPSKAGVLTVRDIMSTADVIADAIADAMDLSGRAYYNQAQRRVAQAGETPALLYERGMVDAARAGLSALEAARRGAAADGGADSDPGRALLADLEVRIVAARAGLASAEAQLQQAIAAAVREPEPDPKSNGLLRGLLTRTP